MKVYILHTNDLHGHLEHWPVIEQYFEITTRLHEQQVNNVLRVDIGDAIDTAHPLVEATQGQIIVDLFNRADYHVVTIGNNEGLGLSSERLTALYKETNYPIVLANLYQIDTEHLPKWAKRYHKHSLTEDISIYFIGLTANYASYRLNGYSPIDPLEALRLTLSTIEKESPLDMIVVLSHVGYQTDIEIAERFPEINLIIGSHTHHLLNYGEKHNQTMLAAAGKYGNYVGQIELSIDDEYVNNPNDAPLNPWDIHCSVQSIYQLSDITGLPIDKESLELEGRKQLNERKIAEIPLSLFAKDLVGQQSLLQVALEAISWKTGISAAILNSGLFLRDIEKGIVSRNDLHESLPHPMHLVILTISGNHLKLLLDEMYINSRNLEDKRIVGMGFRGKVFGKLIFKDLEYQSDKNHWFYQNQAIDDNKDYQIVTVDHLWFIPFFPTIDQFAKPKLLFPDFIRHVVGEYLANKYPIVKTE